MTESSDTLIRVCNVSKTYHVWKTPLSRLLVPLLKRLPLGIATNWVEDYARRHCEPVEALKNINFSMQQGDSLGVIGLNGSGKSTLLQIIAGTLLPTSGTIEVKGRVAALLELGSGFDPEFSGRENVYLNAALLGLTKQEIDTRYDEIIAFADIGEFINRPVNTYSSGMMVRLAFAVQVHVDPDVLIVDEALAVGDARFQAKALNKIEQIISQGTSLLFVGHDLNAVRSFCRHAMLLDLGHIIKQGSPEDVIIDYLRLIQAQNLEQAGQSKSSQISLNNGFSIAGINILKAEFESLGQHAVLNYDDTAVINLELEILQPLSDPFLIIDIVDTRGIQLTGKRIAIPKNLSHPRIQVEIQCCIQKGLYRFHLRIVNAPDISQTKLLYRQVDLLTLEMLDDVRHLFTGLFPIPLNSQWL